MREERIFNIIGKIESIILELLPPLRADKEIDEKAFNNFFKYLDELYELVRYETYIPRKLVGILFFIYTTMDSYNKNNDYRDPLFIKTAELEDYLDKIFWESPWKNY